MDVTRVSVRPAEPDEAGALTELTLRAKASHGYDGAFMEAVRDELRITADYVKDHSVFVVEDRRSIAGFYALVVDERVAELDFLFVEPSEHGKGYGRLLWEHAVEEARALGCDEIRIASDPFAERFYLALGAERVGEVRSGSVHGRMLPLLRARLTR